MTKTARKILVLIIAFNVLAAVAATIARAEPGNAIVGQSAITGDHAVDALMAAIKASKKPLPAWALDLAMKAYRTYLTYRNGEKVEQVQRDVAAILKIVAEIKGDVEAGREMSDREYKRTRDLLDAHARTLDLMVGLIDGIERDHAKHKARTNAEIARNRSELRMITTGAAKARAKARAWQHFNRVCSQAEHVWRPGLARCVHVSVAGPRR